MLQLDPRPFTARQLKRMYFAYQREAWDRIAMTLTVFAGDKVHPFDLNPYRKRPDLYNSRAIEAEYNRLKAKTKQ